MRASKSLVRAVALAAAVLAAASCSNQGQGDRCDVNNGDSDCESGLVCTPLSVLPGLNETTLNAAICCPPPGTNTSSTIDACSRSSRTVTDSGTSSSTDAAPAADDGSTKDASGSTPGAKTDGAP
jgi:hypothetical protein